MTDPIVAFLKVVTALVCFVAGSLVLYQGLLDLVGGETATLLSCAAFLFSLGYWTGL